jgi:reactive intermediate/imine deaminase
VRILATLIACAALAVAPSVAQQAETPAINLGPSGYDTGDYVYVSGQGPSGSGSADFPDQARQSLDNVRKVVESAGLTMDNIVYVQVYLTDINRFAELNEVFAKYFPHDPPARGVLGVARLPQSAPVQITAVAVRDLKGKQAVAVPGFAPSKAYSPGMLTHDRLFVSTMTGSDPATGKVPQDPAEQVKLALDRLNSTVQAAGLTLANMVFVNPYLTLTEIPSRTMNEQYARRFEFGNTPARATIEVSSLPEGTHIAFTGVAVRDLSQRHSIRPKNMPPSPTASPCVFAGDTLYCSAKSGFIPGPNGGIFTPSIPDQTRQTMRNLLDNLEEADMNYDQVVSTVIYLDDLKDTSAFANVYKKYFKVSLPSQTTVQQVSPVDRNADKEERYPTLEQVSLIAVRNAKIHPLP